MSSKIEENFLTDIDKQIKKELSKVGEVSREVATEVINTLEKIPPLFGHPDSPWATGFFASQHIVDVGGVEHSITDIFFQEGLVKPGEVITIFSPVPYAIQILETGWGSTPAHYTYERAEVEVEFEIDAICKKVSNRIDKK